MGVITEIYIAKRNEAQALADSEEVFNEFEGTDAFDTVVMDSLCRILTGKEWPMDKLAERTEEEGPWVLDIPDDFTNSLSVLEGEGLSRVIDELHDTDELAIMEREDVEDCLVPIVELATKAVEQNKGLLIWMCL